MIGNITWAGVALSSITANWTDGGVLIEHAPETNRPRRKFDRYEVPGRNGDVIISQDAFENVTREYDLVVYGGDYDQMAADLMTWLYAPEGYQRLTDSFDADVYRLAFASDETDIEDIMHTDGKCTVAFSCDPRRFLLTGERAVSFSASGSITNPTRFTAKPTITVYGSGAGTIAAGGKTVEISSIYDGMVIDAENCSAFYGASNLNNLVSGSFPEIPAGTQTITITGGITLLEVVPNWWTI